MDRLIFKDGKHLSHAYIVSSAAAQVRDEIATELAQALVCTGGGETPCRACRDCRKAVAGIHPDVITIDRQADENGKSEKEIYVDQVRAVVRDAYVLPNEAPRKVYIFKDADTMNANAQNAALKLLEEPPASAAFILCAANTAMLLPTVRSRCVEIHRNADEDALPGESVELAGDFINAAASGDGSKILKWCVANEGMELAAARNFVDAAIEKVNDMLCLREDARDMDRARLMHLMRLFLKCRDYLGANTGVKHVFGLLAVDAAPDGKKKT